MRCANCDAELAGEYCHACGQHAAEADDLAVGPLVRHFTHELLHLDFKTLHTLRALLTPGFLTREFLEGRRRRYLSPLKLYFVCAAIFFVTAPFVGFNLFGILNSDAAGQMQQLVQDRARERSMDMALFAERFNARVQTVMTLSYGLSIFVTAALLQVLFRRRPLGVHIVFSLHYVAFLYLAALGLNAVQTALDLRAPAVSMLLTYAVIAPYLFVGLRRVYQQSAGRTMAKLAVLCLITFFIDSLVSLGALMLTLWLV